MKKFLLTLLSIVMVCSLVACGSKTNEDTANAGDSPVTI